MGGGGGGGGGECIHVVLFLDFLYYIHSYQRRASSVLKA